MKIELKSLTEGAETARGIVVIIDVFRAFTAAAVALDRGAQSILMVDTVEEALARVKAGHADLAIGEREGRKPPGCDFGNSPAELTSADLAGKRLVQSTTNGTAGLHAARNAEALFAGSFVTADATVKALLRTKPETVSLVAMGRGGKVRADEDEICALYLRSRLEGRDPDAEAVQRLLSTMVPPVAQQLLASGDYDLRDREIALQINSLPFAIAVSSEEGALVARRT
jgi:2-phosphosulfolactate phosphatase